MRLNCERFISIGAHILQKTTKDDRPKCFTKSCRTEIVYFDITIIVFSKMKALRSNLFVRMIYTCASFTQSNF